MLHVRECDRSFHRRLRSLKIRKIPEVSNPVVLGVQVRGVECTPCVHFHHMAQMAFAVMERANVLRNTPSSRARRRNCRPIDCHRRPLECCDSCVTKPAGRSLFQSKLAHHSPTLRSVSPPRQHPGSEPGQPRISAPVSHMYRLGGSGNIAPSFNVRRVLVLRANSRALLRGRSVKELEIRVGPAHRRQAATCQEIMVVGGQYGIWRLHNLSSA
jgi:hypothetical protein